MYDQINYDEELEAIDDQEREYEEAWRESERQLEESRQD